MLNLEEVKIETTLFCKHNDDTPSMCNWSVFFSEELGPCNLLACLLND